MVITIWWYEIERYPTWYERRGHCAAKVLTQYEDGVELEHSFVRDGIEYVLHVNATVGEGATIAVNGSNIGEWRVVTFEKRMCVLNPNSLSVRDGE
ncbi:hypothetical protein EVAR_7931_1 [Eumeta japonica]|uniref:Uncharacterized protein n=1 Tax=Eumeta variegata TaxID=151549 RepID=A0A4C1TVK8_EUMVA|nr:hypothetical protein EVAR_7931_1 [Eumeta japonica]